MTTYTETICWLARDILVDDTFVDNDVPYIRAENLYKDK
jgi:hypothetical protein